MYAIVEVLGKQYRVQEGNKVVVDLMNAEKDSEVSLDRVLMIGGENTKIGTPVVEGAKVTAKVVDHILGDKVVVFKHKRRKAERRTPVVVEFEGNDSIEHLRCTGKMFGRPLFDKATYTQVATVLASGKHHALGREVYPVGHPFGTMLENPLQNGPATTTDVKDLP